MTAPSVDITKQDGNTGVVSPSQTGVLAIIAPAAGGTANQPGSYTRQSDMLSEFIGGPLVEDSAYYFDTAQLPVVAMSPTCSTAAAFGTINHSGEVGTSTITFTGTPIDEFDIIVKFPLGGTVATGPISYQYSLDNGSTWSAVQALGVATTAVLYLPRPSTTSSGVTMNLGSGTIVTGDVVMVPTTHADMTNGDLVTALAALQASKLPWDNLYIDTIATATTIATVDAWLSSLEATGVFKMAWMNIRHKTKPVPTGETEAAYATAAGVVVGATSTFRVDVGADGGYVPSLVSGLLLFRQTALGVATRSNPLPEGTDPAFVELGPIPGFQIADVNGNPLWHDEQIFPGLDNLRLSTLRTFPGKIGTYITNANMLSVPGSDYVFDQHAKTSNTACSIGYQELTDNLSRGVHKQPEDPTTHKIYIDPLDAESIEESANIAMGDELSGQVQGVAMLLSRTDDLGSNAGATLNADIETESLAYIKKFNVISKFVRQITATQTS
jgi:hypothetical protein